MLVVCRLWFVVFSPKNLLCSLFVGDAIHQFLKGHVLAFGSIRAIGEKIGV